MNRTKPGTDQVLSCIPVFFFHVPLIFMVFVVDLSAEITWPWSFVNFSKLRQKSETDYLSPWLQIPVFWQWYNSKFDAKKKKLYLFTGFLIFTSCILYNTYTLCIVRKSKFDPQIRKKKIKSGVLPITGSSKHGVWSYKASYLSL